MLYTQVSYLFSHDSGKTHSKPKLNMNSTEFLFVLDTLSVSNSRIGMRRMVKSMAIETPLEAKVAVLLSMHLETMLLSKTPPKSYVNPRLLQRSKSTHGKECIEKQ